MTIELHRCKVCGVLFGTEGTIKGKDAEICQCCIIDNEKENEECSSP